MCGKLRFAKSPIWGTGRSSWRGRAAKVGPGRRSRTAWDRARTLRDARLGQLDVEGVVDAIQEAGAGDGADQPERLPYRPCNCRAAGLTDWNVVPTGANAELRCLCSRWRSHGLSGHQPWAPLSAPLA